MTTNSLHGKEKDCVQLAVRRVVNVIGTPAPQGSKRHVGRGIMVESSKSVKPWRDAVAWACREQGDGLIPSAVSVRIEFWMHRPKCAKRRIWADRKPDTDKLCRSTLDALVTAGVIEDDARVVYLLAYKRYTTAEHPAAGADITIASADAAEAVADLERQI